MKEKVLLYFKTCTERFAKDSLLGCKRLSLAMQGTIFRMTEDYLLPCETASFANNLGQNLKN